MKPTKKIFQHESLQDAKKVEKILQAMSDGIASGKLKFSDEDDEIVFKPDGLMQVKLSAIQDGNLQRFNIKVSWHLDEQKMKNNHLKVNE